METRRTFYYVSESAFHLQTAMIGRSSLCNMEWNTGAGYSDVDAIPYVIISPIMNIENNPSPTINFDLWYFTNEMRMRQTWVLKLM